MKVEEELKAIRYLINDMLLGLYNLQLSVNEMIPKERVRKVIDPNAGGNSVGFDFFSIRRNVYEDLVNTYGVDVVNSACAKLDEYVKVNQYTPYGAPTHALKRKFIKEVLYENDIKRKDKAQSNGV